MLKLLASETTKRRLALARAFLVTVAGGDEFVRLRRKVGIQAAQAAGGSQGRWGVVPAG